MSSRGASPQARLRELGIGPKRSLGQHFLHDANVVERIVAVAHLPRDATVIEIGPGLGILTEALARQVRRVVAIEKDGELAGNLQSLAPDNVDVVHADALTFDPDSLPESDFHVVANLPYNVATAIIRRLLDARRRPQSMTVMVQREVADRIIARPPNMTILSVAMQFHGDPRLELTIGRGAFTPPPRVTSAVVRLQVQHPPPLDPESFEPFFGLVRAGFGTRRKQLKNALSAGLELSADTVQRALCSADIASTARAQELDVADWQRLFHRLHGDVSERRS